MLYIFKGSRIFFRLNIYDRHDGILLSWKFRNETLKKKLFDSYITWINFFFCLIPTGLAIRPKSYRPEERDCSAWEGLPRAEGKDRQETGSHEVRVRLRVWERLPHRGQELHARSCSRFVAQDKQHQTGLRHSECSAEENCHTKWSAHFRLPVSGTITQSQISPNSPMPRSAWSRSAPGPGNSFSTSSMATSSPTSLGLSASQRLTACLPFPWSREEKDFASQWCWKFRPKNVR